MTEITKDTLFQTAVDVLHLNDRGTYTVPTSGLYPFQWNWDSCLVALGQRHVDEARAWKELETLFAHQWDDGMVPHIVFHEMDDGYFPGPDVWKTGRSTPTTGITQPAVAGFAVNRLYEHAKDKTLAIEKAQALLHGIDRWHSWFYHYRDPKNTGLVALIHPWEAGRDNSVDWDDPFDSVPTDGIGAYQRRDTQHASAEHRPTSEQYDRYLWLVQRFRSLGWDNQQLHDASPFQVVDPGFNALLIRSCADISALAETLGEQEIAARNKAFANKALNALDGLWSDRLNQYVCFDRVKGSTIESPSVGGLIPVVAPIPKERADAIAARINEWGERCQYLVPSHDPADASFDSKRYWRGPSWLIVNYLIADGLRNAGIHDVAANIEKQSLKLIQKSGFAEYYDPISGEPCGGKTFTWTAAMVLEFLRTSDDA